MIQMFFCRYNRSSFQFSLWKSERSSGNITLEKGTGRKENGEFSFFSISRGNTTAQGFTVFKVFLQ
jgi:hypothetical protein